MEPYRNDGPLADGIRIIPVLSSRQMGRLPDEDLSELGARLRALRERAGLSQEELADLAGVTRPQISEIERGRSRPQIATRDALRGVLGQKLDLVVSRGFWDGPDPTAPQPRPVAPAVALELENGFRVIDTRVQNLGVPVAAYVAAGHGGWEDAPGGETVTLPSFLLGPSDFVVRAVGDSMIDEGIEDGDFLIVERRDNGIATHGDLVIAWLNDGLVIKRWYRRNGRKFLESANAEMGWQPREITTSDVFEIQGVVRHIVKSPAPRKRPLAEERAPTPSQGSVARNSVNRDGRRVPVVSEPSYTVPAGMPDPRRDLGDLYDDEPGGSDAVRRHTTQPPTTGTKRDKG